MRSALIVIGFVGAGLVGAVGGRILFPAPEPLQPDDPGRLEAEVDDLRAQVARLTEEVRRDREAPPPLPAPAMATEDTFGRPTGETRAAPTPGAPEVIVDPDALDEKVRDAVEARAKAEREERVRQAAVVQAEKDDRFLTRLKDALDLTDFQRDELGKHLKSRRGAASEYRRKLTEGGPDLTTAEREAIRQELQDFVDLQNEEMKKLLGVDKYDEMIKLTSGGNRTGGGRR